MRRAVYSTLIATALAATALLSGCASPNAEKIDPYQGFNRAMFSFNNGVDRILLKPVAQVYDAAIPSPVRSGVGNVVSNIGEVNDMANDILQLKPKYFLVNFWRFVLNSTFGIGGLFDVASAMGLPKHDTDFGLTLAYYSGGSHSPYLVLPFLGPSTFRSTFGRPFDYFLEPFAYVDYDHLSYYVTGAKVIHFRAKLLPLDSAIKNAFDPYIFVRNAYLQRRNQQIAASQKNL